MFIAKHPPDKFHPRLDVDVACAEIFKPAIVVVPNPVFETEISVVDAEETTSSAFPVELPHTVRFAYGEVVPTPNFPDEVNVEVAVPPKYAVYAEKIDDEALVNLFKPVQ